MGPLYIQIRGWGVGKRASREVASGSYFFLLLVSAQVRKAARHCIRTLLAYNVRAMKVAWGVLHA